MRVHVQAPNQQTDSIETRDKKISIIHDNPKNTATTTFPRSQQNHKGICLDSDNVDPEASVVSLVLGVAVNLALDPMNRIPIRCRETYISNCAIDGRGKQSIRNLLLISGVLGLARPEAPLRWPANHLS
jgi:hypothetical protein